MSIVDGPAWEKENPPEDRGNLRDRINKGEPRCHELSRAILNLDWYDTESQARRVIYWIVEEEKANADLRTCRLPIHG